MPATTSPFFGINYGWLTGESGWGDPVNDNFKALSFLDKGSVDSFVASLPLSPSEGDSVIYTFDNQMYIRIGGGWFFISPEEGMEINETSTGKRYRFSSSSWVEVTYLQKADLTNTADPAKGASLIGNGIVAVDSFSQLRTLLKTQPSKKAQLKGFEYYLDAVDVSSVEDLPSTVVATDGGRWKLNSTLPTDIVQYGAQPILAFDSSPAIQAAFSDGGSHTAKDGFYNLNSTVLADYSDPLFPEVTYPSKRLSFSGNSTANTIFQFNPINPVDQAFKMVGATPPTPTQGIHGQDYFGKLSITSALRNKFGLGLWVMNKAYLRVEDYATESLNTGIEIDGVLSSTFHRMTLKNGTIGVVMNQTAVSLPNSNSFYDLILGGNSQAGLVANTIGAGNLFQTAKVEQNGTQGVAGHGGMIMNVSGLNGSACVHIDAAYFEDNAGDADLKIDNISALPVTVTISNCVFNRVSASRWTTSNCIFTSSGGGLLTVVLQANAHLSLNTYVPSAARPFIQVGANVKVIGWDTCTYNEITSIASTFNSASSAIESGSVNAAGTILNAPVGVSVVRAAAGTYDITMSGSGWAATTLGYNPFVVPNTAGLKLDSLIKTNVNTFRATFRPNDAAPLADSAFSFMVAKVQ